MDEALLVGIIQGLDRLEEDLLGLRGPQPPLGVDVPVIAWGLGLDRMAMVALDIHDIRDLFSTDLEMIRTTRSHF